MLLVRIDTLLDFVVSTSGYFIGINPLDEIVQTTYPDGNNLSIIDLSYCMTDPATIFQYNNTVYIANATNASGPTCGGYSFFSIETTSPFTITPEWPSFGTNIIGGSQIHGCFDLYFQFGTTTGCNCYEFTAVGENGAYSYIDCNGNSVPLDIINVG